MQEVAAREEAEALALAGNTSSAQQLLEIGSAHLEGELAAAAGEYGEAVAALRVAESRHASLVYMEPPP